MMFTHPWQIKKNTFLRICWFVGSAAESIKDIKEKSVEKRKPSYGIVQSIFQTKAELTAETSM